MQIRKFNPVRFSPHSCVPTPSKTDTGHLTASPTARPHTSPRWQSFHRGLELSWPLPPITRKPYCLFSSFPIPWEPQIMKNIKCQVKKTFLERNSPKEVVLLSFLQRAVSEKVVNSLKHYSVRMSAVTQHKQVNSQCAVLKCQYSLKHTKADRMKMSHWCGKYYFLTKTTCCWTGSTRN